MNESNTYVNGTLRLQNTGLFKGSLIIDGVDISPIQAKFFKRDDSTYLWMNRCPILEYDNDEKKYRERMSLPAWEAYLEKKSGSTYVGEFFFLRFKYTIIAQWSNHELERPYECLNVFVERAPLSEQTIINNIYENKKKNDRRK